MGQLPERLQDVKIPWGPIGEQVYKRSYSLRKADGTKETWPETVVRAVDGNLGLVDPKFIEEGEREKLIELLLTFGIVPAGRHLNASGVKGRQFLFNCHASGWDHQDAVAHFTFLFDELMQGGGVGANYSNRYMEMLPIVVGTVHLHVICDQKHPDHHEFADLLSNHDALEKHGEAKKISYVVADDREGWIQSVRVVMEQAFNTPGESVVIIDVSKIREKGRLLKTSGGGIACGPGPLVSMLINLSKHLNGCVGRCLSSLDAMMLDHTLAACVVAGGKRRSSRMSVKNWRDYDIFEFINCKKVDGDHWTTNISVEVDRDFFEAYRAFDSHAAAVMKAIILGKRANGEPGIWNRTRAMAGEREPNHIYCPNPCGEIALYMWENCNLGHVNMGYFAKKPKAEMMKAFDLMARWLVRATFGDIPQERQRKIVDQNRRIGVGFFGFHEWLAMRGIKYSKCYESLEVINTLRAAHATAELSASSYAMQQGIPVPVKFTTLAPTGTIVCMPGTTGSGQAMKTPWYKRLVRYSDMDPELTVKRQEGYEVFPDEDAENTSIVVYWCEDPLVAKVRANGMDPAVILEGEFDIAFQDSLKVQAMLQEVYADNAISYTISLPLEKLPTEEEMEKQLFEVLPRLKGTTFFPEKSRKNAPIQPITREQFDAHPGQKEISQVEDECKNGCPIF